MPKLPKLIKQLFFFVPLSLFNMRRLYPTRYAFFISSRLICARGLIFLKIFSKQITYKNFSTFYKKIRSRTRPYNRLASTTYTSLQRKVASSHFLICKTGYYGPLVVSLKGRSPVVHCVQSCWKVPLYFLQKLQHILRKNT